MSYFSHSGEYICKVIAFVLFSMKKHENWWINSTEHGILQPLFCIFPICLRWRRHLSWTHPTGFCRRLAQSSASPTLSSINHSSRRMTISLEWHTPREAQTKLSNLKTKRLLIQILPMTTLPVSNHTSLLLLLLGYVMQTSVHLFGKCPFWGNPCWSSLTPHLCPAFCIVTTFSM